MSFRQLLRKLRPLPLQPTLRLSPFRFSAYRSSSSDARTNARIDKVLSRVPRFLRPYTDSLRTAPVSNLVSFLILHEITAIVPLVGFAGLFHWMEWIPNFAGDGSAVGEGVERFGRYFTRKGWFGFSRDGGASTVGGEESISGQTVEKEVEGVERKWHVSEASGRVLIEVATAYAITKLLLPARIIFSVWATPWFARLLGRAGTGVGKIFGRGKATKRSTNHGTTVREKEIP